MTVGVFDAAAVARRRRELFPPVFEPLWQGEVTVWGVDERDRFGTPTDHCAICPRQASERCVLNCTKERKALNDGVTVT